VYKLLKNESPEKWKKWTDHLKRQKMSQHIAKDESNAHIQEFQEQSPHQSKIFTTNKEIGGHYAWIRAFTSLPAPMIKFILNAFHDSLPTRQNLARWKVMDNVSKKVIEPHCILCGSTFVATMDHILCGCRHALDSGRIKWRHDEVLDVIAPAIAEAAKDVFNDPDVEVLIDHQESPHNYTRLPEDLIISERRPDIFLISRTKKKIIIGELTCPMEVNMRSWNERKTQKYTAELANKLIEDGYDVQVFAFEVSALGCIGKSLITFLEAMKLKKNKIKELSDEASFKAMSCSFKIFNQRDAPNQNLTLGQL
jgi:predicted  nucleic acid-binding Zn-ribbon protein